MTRSYDIAIANFVNWLRRHGLEATVYHLNGPVRVSIRKRRPKRSRLTGEAR